MSKLLHLVGLLFSSCLVLGQGHPRITNGKPAWQKLLPYQVWLECTFKESEDPFYCGGTIISKRWILTAAHCLQLTDHELENVLVFAGIVNTTDDDEPGRVEILVDKQDTIVHAEYDEHIATYDIALIHLPEDLKLSAYIQPAKLPKRKRPNKYEGRKALVSGWGRMANHEPAEILQYLQVRIIPNILCESLWNKELVGEKKIILDSFLCVNTHHGMPCVGDSGGPLVLDDGSNVVVGVVSHGYDSECKKPVPDVFMRVSSFLDWIEQHTGGLTKH
ncbi:collagenase [Drosophila mojavensis]|uniref:collagenase n=1 Tax=Drosophila mojavensis TaxID=7230 RepID=UPI001CD0AAD5|nr:collagenase [Drosophila mojavensis]